MTPEISAMFARRNANIFRAAKSFRLKVVAQAHGLSISRVKAILAEMRKVA